MKNPRIPRSIKDLPHDILRKLEKVGELAYWGLFKDEVQLVFFDSDIPEGFQSFGSS